MDTLTCLWQTAGRYHIDKLSLYCPKCKQETLVNAKDLQITVISLNF